MLHLLQFLEYQNCNCSVLHTKQTQQKEDFKSLTKFRKEGSKTPKHWDRPVLEF
jgi:hypothetical protein